ncbi:MAG: leucine-rich repeat protein [Lachnospiraceae bacterium]|nr:leucine-rich repeat protein [Lachnospiraceae bacterium]
MKKRIISAVLALCLCMTSHSVAYAWQENPVQQADVLAEGSASGLAASDSTVPTPTEVYESMIALKDREEYKEGTTWTDDEPYSDSKGYYRWKGGPLGGSNIVAVGCVAFAFILSDTAFGSLPARMYEPGKFSYEDIKVGDILRVSNDAHTVIVLEVNAAGVVVAEGNISTGDHKGKIHWGRAISKEEVMSNTSHYITRYPEGYIPPDDPEANVSIGSGSLDGGLTWNLTKAGTLSISGKGAMPEFSSTGDQPWSEKSSQIRQVVIEDGVTSIGSCAFWNCGVLSVEIPSSVATIGNSAFRGSSIIAVTIPANVKTIGDSAFRECPNLSAVTVSEGVETISQNAFRACARLTSIDLPASIGEVGAAAFFDCQALTQVEFAPGSKQVKMGDNMFTRCYYLMKVTLPKSIDRIGEGMFQNCLTLAGLEIPQGAESIEQNAFSSCTAFTTVIIPDSVRSIGIAAFASCFLKDIYFTGTEAQWKSISKIGDTAAAVSKATMHYNYTPNNDDNPGGDNPGGDNPGGDNPGGDNPGGDNPGGDNLGGDNPGGDNPGGDNPEIKSNISEATVTLAQTSYVYDGKAKTPSVTVKLGDKTLALDTDYTVSYINNIEVGTAKVIITAKGNYTGSKTTNFTITKAADQEPTTSITCKKTLYEVSYGSKPFKIKASSGSSMTFTSSNPKIAAVDKATGKVTIKSTGIAVISIYARNAAMDVTVKVSPKKQTIKSIKAVKGKKLTVKWANDKMASGYQVQISTDKSFKKNVQAKKVSKTSHTFTKLKTGKKYYVKVRSYKKVSKESLYGTWSKMGTSSKIKK